MALWGKLALGPNLRCKYWATIFMFYVYCFWHTTEHASDIPKAGVVSGFRHGNIGFVLFSWLPQFLGWSGGYTSFVGALHGVVSGIVRRKCSCRTRVSTAESGSDMNNCFEGGTTAVSGLGQGTSGVWKQLLEKDALPQRRSV
jgi:hypothetical protein